MILKVDPNYPTKRPTTAVFAFSETVWEPRAALYLKNILMLKGNEWERIMSTAMEYLTGAVRYQRERAVLV